MTNTKEQIKALVDCAQKAEYELMAASIQHNCHSCDETATLLGNALLAFTAGEDATPQDDVERVARAIYETDPRADEDGYWMPWEVYKHADDQGYERLVEAAKAAIAAKPRREEARPVTPEGKPIFGEDSAWDVKSYLTAMGTSRQLSEDEAVEVMADTYEKAFESCLGNRSIRRFYALRAAYRALLAASAKGGK